MKNSYQYANVFPLGADVIWHAQQSLFIPDPYLKNWLLDTASLTERLESQCKDFHLTLLGQGSATIFDEERRLLDDSPSQAWQVREVVLHGDGLPWVFARSILPAQMNHAGVAQIGKNALGKVLFNDPNVTRSEFELCTLSSNKVLCAPLNIQSTQSLWGRRSLFYCQGQKMLVAEWFLPNAPAYQRKTNES